MPLSEVISISKMAPWLGFHPPPALFSSWFEWEVGDKDPLLTAKHQYVIPTHRFPIPVDTWRNNNVVLK